MRCVSSLLSAAVAVLALAGYAVAVDRHVPSVYPTIQAAVDAAEDGDHVVVADGIYSGPGNVNISLLGKPITVRSANGAATCIITGMDVLGDHAFIFDSAEHGGTQIVGFTIEHFHTTHEEPGAVRVIDADPQLLELVYRNNTTELADGGLTVSGSALYVIGSPVNRFCEFRDNEGAPIMMAGGAMYVIDCLIEGNTARGSAAGAAENHAFLLIFTTDLINNSVISDSGLARGGAVAHLGGLLDITNCEFENNSAEGPDGALGAAVYIGADFVINASSFREHSGDHDGGTIAVVSQGEFFAGSMSVGVESSTVGALLVDQTAGPLDIHVFGGEFCNNSPYDIEGDVEFFGPPSFCPIGDLDGDGGVGASDLALLLGAWGTCVDVHECAADINGDGGVGAADLALLLAAWAPV